MLDQIWDFFRYLWELFLLAVAFHVALGKLAEALASSIGQALSDVFSQLFWAAAVAGAILVLAPLGYCGFRWLLRAARGRRPRTPPWPGRVHCETGRRHPTSNHTHRGICTRPPF